jgi:tRNA nucleotidyltransferase/poly(A) polymerase/DNA polymerase III epsilon subunit-like protein
VRDATEVVSGLVSDSPDQLSGLTLVDEQGRPVKYSPTWVTNRGSVIGTPRPTLGLPTIGGGGRTVGEMYGVIGGSPLQVPDGSEIEVDDLADAILPMDLMPPRVSFTPGRATLIDSILRVDGEYTLNGEKVSKRVGSRGRMEHSDLPDVLFHVTTAGDAVRDDGSLRVSTGGNGLGGGSADDLSVSLTVDRVIAEQLYEDMRMIAISKADKWDYDQALAELQKRSKAEGWGYTPGILRTSVGTNLKGLMDDYFVRRNSATGRANPLFFGELQAHPDQIRIVSVDKRNIPSAAMITDFDLDTPSGLREVRVWGDVPVVQPDGLDGIPMDEVLLSTPDLMSNFDRYMPRGGNDRDVDIYAETESALGDLVRGNTTTVYASMPDGMTLPSDPSITYPVSLSRSHAERDIHPRSSVQEIEVSASDLMWMGDGFPDMWFRGSETGTKGGPTASDRALYPELFNAEGYLMEPEKPEDLRLRPSPPPFSGVVEAMARNNQGFGSWSKFKKDLFKEDIVVFDYESTDLLDNGGKPVQIGAVRMSGGIVTDRFNVFMDPGQKVDEWSEFSVGNLRDEFGQPITQDYMDGQVSSVDAHAEFIEFIGQTGILVGHNIKGFDLPMFKEHLDEQQIDFDTDGIVDTLSLARMMLPSGKDDPNSVVNSHTLGDLSDLFGIDLGDAAHTADADSDATAQLLGKLLDYGEEHKVSTDLLNPDRAASRYASELSRREAAKDRYEELQRVHADLRRRGYDGSPQESNVRVQRLTNDGNGNVVDENGKIVGFTGSREEIEAAAAKLEVDQQEAREQFERDFGVFTPAPLLLDGGGSQEVPNIDNEAARSRLGPVKKEQKFFTTYDATDSEFSDGFREILGDGMQSMSVEVSDGADNHKVSVNAALPDGDGNTTAATITWNHETGKIEGISVDERFQRRGLGTELHRAANAIAASQGLVAPKQSDNLTDEGRALRNSLGILNPEEATEAASALGEPVRRALEIATPDDLEPIHDVFKENDKKLLLVGGAVRDTLLGREPKDFDLATDATSDEVMGMLRASDPSLDIALTGEDFPVVRVKTPDGIEYEIATFRRDIGEGDEATSVAGSIEDDVVRRDLTINAMYYDLDSREVIDYVGGMADIDSGVVRSVGNSEDRFREDKLRILRALRFSGRTGFDLDEDTKKAIRKDNDLTNVSNERIHGEFLSGLNSAKDQAAFLRLVDEMGLFPQIFQGSDIKINLEKLPPRGANYKSVMASILSDNDPSDVGKMLTDMKYTNAEVEEVKFMLEFLTVTPETAPKLKKKFNRFFEARRMDQNQLREYARSQGIPGYQHGAFLEFALQPQAVSSEDLIEQGLKGPEIGRAIAEADSARYSEILSRLTPAPKPTASEIAASHRADIERVEAGRKAYTERLDSVEAPTPQGTHPELLEGVPVKDLGRNSVDENWEVVELTPEAARTRFRDTVHEFLSNDDRDKLDAMTPEEFDEFTQSGYEFLRESLGSDHKLSLQMDDDALRSMVNGDGEIKNQHGSGSSGGYLGRDLRDAQEQKLGVPVEADPKLVDATDTFRPKYGFVDGGEESIWPQHVSHYGSLTVELDSDRMRDRATVTFGDSLNHDLHGVSYNDFVNGEADPVRVMMASDPQSLKMMWDQANKEGDSIDFSPAPGKRERDGDQLRDRPPYVEVQFHGRVSLDDVVGIDSSDTAGWRGKTRPLIPKLQEAGIRVFDPIKGEWVEAIDRDGDGTVLDGTEGERRA